MRLIRSSERGHTRLPWLSSHHTYSFGDYHNPERVRFGALRVVNDDRIAPGKGFGMHPHRDMEIITLVTRGSLQHEDSIGSRGIVRAGECQVMSAGSGIVHSEINASSTEPVELFQIWIDTRAQGIAARYDQQHFEVVLGNETIVASGRGAGLHIEQNASVSLLDTIAESTHRLDVPRGMGCYVLVVEGIVRIGPHTLHRRDSVEATAAADIACIENARLLLIRVPL